MIARNRKGFTLIELLLVAAIVGILAAIAIPRFLAYRLHAKTVEAKALMAAIAVNQTTFVSEFGNYANIDSPNPPTSPRSEKTPWPIVPCDPACKRTNAAACTSFECIGFSSPGAVFYQYASPNFAVQGSPPEFAIEAAGDLDSDSNNGSFAYQSGNHGGSQGVVDPVLAACPKEISVKTYENCAPHAY